MGIREKLPYLISGVIVLIIVIIFLILYSTERRIKEERKLFQKTTEELEAKRLKEKEELERKLAELEAKRLKEKEELERKRKEEELKKQQEELERKRRLENAYKEIEIVKWYWYKGSSGDFILSIGGITFDWVELYNPTDYTFDWVECEFYDKNDNVVKYKKKVGPLYPHEVKKFKIDKWVEGLWEHDYGVRIIDGKARE